MKKRIMTRFFLLSLVCLTMLFASACGSETSQEKTPAVDSVEITISIDYPAKSNRADVQEVQFMIEEDSTVLETIQLYGNVNNLPILVETTHGTLEGIDGINNGVYQKKGSWQCKINGKVSDDEEVLKDGDFVEWAYLK